jgi:hypothetical protein
MTRLRHDKFLPAHDELCISTLKHDNIKWILRWNRKSRTHTTDKSEYFIADFVIRRVGTNLGNVARELDAEYRGCPWWRRVVTFSLRYIHSIKTEGPDLDIKSKVLITNNLKLKQIKHTFTRTWPASGLGFGTSPIYRFVMGPLPSLISTARIELIVEIVYKL